MLKTVTKVKNCFLESGLFSSCLDDFPFSLSLVIDHLIKKITATSPIPKNKPIQPNSIVVIIGIHIYHKGIKTKINNGIPTTRAPMAVISKNKMSIIASDFN